MKAEIDTEEWLSSVKLKPRRPLFSQRLAQLLGPLEHGFQRLYGSDYNPTYQSGVLALFFMALAMVSGVILLFYYRVSAPYESMQVIQAQFWGGRWLRGLHRFSSDAAIVAVVVHVLRMVVSGRTWGPRALTWWTGILLTALMVVIGVTGLMMVWDTQAHRLASDSAKLVAGLPIFSEPIGRMFADNASVTQAFFFVLMFLHLAMPLGLAALTWLHTVHLARVRLWPEPHLVKFYGLSILVLSIFWPLPLAPKADLLSLPHSTPLDWFYAFWVPPLEQWGEGGEWAFFIGAVGLLASVPWWCKVGPVRTPPSAVDERSCTGCTQCYQDCPYEAISMVTRGRPFLEGRFSETVARVDPDLCVSCGICAGSCAPMGVGPPMRTGRDQLHDIEDFLGNCNLQAQDVVVLACRWGCGESSRWEREPGVHLLATGCSGSLHTSVVEWLLRHQVAGVIIVSCPERNCSHREGAKWLPLRLFHDREAELQARVDRRRVHHLQHPLAEIEEALQEIRNFRLRVLELPSSSDLKATSGETECRGLEAMASPPNQAPAPLLKGGWKAHLATLAWMALLASLGQAWFGTTAHNSLLRLSWRANGKQIRVPRQQDAELPAHMRAPQGEAWDLRIQSCDLTVQVDGKLLLQRKVEAPGYNHDRPLSVFEELPLSPGLHHLQIRFAAEGAEDANTQAVLEQDLECRAGRVVLVELEGDKNLRVTNE